VGSSENGTILQEAGVDRNWHALYTRHQHEKSVAQSLSNRGHDVFLPLVGAAHRWQDRNKQIWLPLFPCYVFIRGGPYPIAQVLSTLGVISIVSSGGRPALIPCVQIESVRQMITSKQQVEAHPFLQCGDRVRVVAGPLRGIEGILIRKKGAFRLVVGIDMLGGSAAVEIDTSCIEASNLSSVPLATNSMRVSAPV
jgi:transcription antitermination factor NusG